MGFTGNMQYLAAAGTTGSNTSAAMQVGNTYNTLAFQFVVEAVGATPTVTYKYQGSIDGTNWYDVGYITDAADGISQATRVMTATGAQVAYLSNPVGRKYKWFRVVTSANTNVTYRAEIYPLN